MRKIIAVVLTVLMIIPLGIVVSSAEATNIARGMTYEFTGAYTDENGKLWYPDTGNKELTDGKKSESASDIGYSDAELPLWVGLNTNGAGGDKDNALNYIIVDLGEKKTNLTRFVVYSEEIKGPGILKPKDIEVFVSDDKVNFTSVGKVDTPEKTADLAGSQDAGDGLYTYTVTGNASGRYVKFLIHHGSNWAFISEVEIYQDPDAEPAPVQETIVIDGKFDDTGWKEDGWLHADSTNTTLFGKYEGRNDTFDIQFRTDDTKLYIALKSNNKPFGTDDVYGNGRGSMFRIWVFTNGYKDDAGNEYTTYNYILDFMYKNGQLEYVARKNAKYNGNSHSPVTIDGFEAASTSSDNYFYVEAAIPFAGIGATTGTNVFVTYSGPTEIGTPDANGNQPTNASFTYPKLGTYTNDKGEEKTSWAYERWDKENDIELVFADLKLGTIEQDKDDHMPIDLGDPMEDPAYTLELSTTPEKYKPGETITVRVTVKDIKAEGGLSLIRFKLFYDPSRVEPVVKNDPENNNDNMFSFLKNAPAQWDDSICKLVEEEGYYDISFLNDSKTGYAQEDGSLVIEIPFKVKENTKGKLAFQIPHNAPGTNGADSKAAKVFGNGGYVLVERDTSKPAPSSSSSSTTTSTPPTGDVGTFSIVLIAMLALAGAATVAVKKRSR